MRPALGAPTHSVRRGCSFQRVATKQALLCIDSTPERSSHQVRVKCEATSYRQQDRHTVAQEQTKTETDYSHAIQFAQHVPSRPPFEVIRSYSEQHYPGQKQDDPAARGRKLNDRRTGSEGTRESCSFFWPDFRKPKLLPIGNPYFSRVVQSHGACILIRSNPAGKARVKRNKVTPRWGAILFGALVPRMAPSRPGPLRLTAALWNVTPSA
jgi:hypothetical protein